MTMAEEEDEERIYQKELRKRVNEAMKRAQLDQQKRELMRQFLEPAAYERLMNIRLTNADLYEQLVALIVQLAQGGRVSASMKMTEEQFKSILEKVTYRKEPTIEFKHK